MKSNVFNCLVLILLCLMFAVSNLSAGAFYEFAVDPQESNQEMPDISNGVIVWQENLGDDNASDWDIYGVDISDMDNLIHFTVSDDADDQINPVIDANNVAFQSYFETDYDLYLADISDRSAVDVIGVSRQINIHEVNPALSGNTILWEDNRYGDYDIYGMDIIDRKDPREFIITPYSENQRHPAIYRNRVVWQDDYFGDWDISSSDIWRNDKPVEYSVMYSAGRQESPAISNDIVVWQDDFHGDYDIYAADVSDPENPEFFSISTAENSQVNPDVDGNIVVWQDDWSGDWDIYGYNLTTGMEFVICDEPSDQMNPAISGNVVVWQDLRNGVWTIYAAVLDGPEIAVCIDEIPGDADGNCQVNILDFVLMAQNWLRCDLVPYDDCN